MSTQHRTLLNASARAANVTEHILVYRENGEVIVTGTHELVNEAEKNLQVIKDMLGTVAVSGTLNPKTTKREVNFPLLPYSPTSTEWTSMKGRARSLLASFTKAFGFTKNASKGVVKKVLGMGDAPEGWDEGIFEWKNFHGPFKTPGLSARDCKLLVLAMLRHAGINPEDHVEPEPEQDDAHEGEDVPEVNIAPLSPSRQRDVLGGNYLPHEEYNLPPADQQRAHEEEDVLPPQSPWKQQNRGSSVTKKKNIKKFQKVITPKRHGTRSTKRSTRKK